jgi:hypothetical protein
MKRNVFLPFFCLLFAITGKTMAADITITGATDVNSSTNFTYYAIPPSPIPSGTTYTWHIYGATIVAQNTDPTAGPLYCTVRWDAILGQGAVTIEDNNGNSGLLFVTIYGFSATKRDANNFPVKQVYQPLDAITWSNKVLAVA